MIEPGDIRCPFRGWPFDADGSLRDIPKKPKAKRDRIRATWFPVRECDSEVIPSD
jgi:phenylpropionate dioxygenase-like ring-hydroxylating dioxygenase large terminal subunit